MDATSRRAATDTGGESTFEEVQASEEFQQLKRTLRRFIFPATAGFLAWYLLYVLMSAYARGFMGIELFGNINVAYVFGLLQFVSTFAIAYVYSKYADKHFDPSADRIRHRIEGTQP
jgi:uncharacterized membrane protein (DUF485 family)